MGLSPSRCSVPLALARDFEHKEFNDLHSYKHIQINLFFIHFLTQLENHPLVTGFLDCWFTPQLGIVHWAGVMHGLSGQQQQLNPAGAQHLWDLMRDAGGHQTPSWISEKTAWVRWWARSMWDAGPHLRTESAGLISHQLPKSSRSDKHEDMKERADVKPRRGCFDWFVYMFVFHSPLTLSFFVSEILLKIAN